MYVRSRSQVAPAREVESTGNWMSRHGSTSEAHQTKLTSELIHNVLDATELFGGERARFGVQSDATPIMCSKCFLFTCNAASV